MEMWQVEWREVERVRMWEIARCSSAVNIVGVGVDMCFGMDGWWLEGCFMGVLGSMYRLLGRDVCGGDMGKEC